jgi:hypothetical protein
MTLNIERGDTLITVDGQATVEVHRDYRGNINDLMFFADAAPSEVHTAVLRSMVMYIHQYVRRLSAEDVARLSHDDLVKEIGAVGIGISLALYPSVEAAIDDAIQKVGVSGLSYTVVNDRRSLIGNTIRLELRVEQSNRFTFWKSEWKPSHDDGLHIIPSYHPALNGWEEVGMINGDTDYLIRGKTVEHFYCPTEAQTGSDVQFKGSSWSHVKHPFRADGQDMQLEVDTTTIRSHEGVEELAKILRASLNLDKTYVAINGGFRPPMKCPNNRLLELRRQSPWPKANYSNQGHVARGSENHCVWAHRTLQEEGVLAESYIPSWFIPEGWLGIYEGAEIRPGIY